MSGKADERWRAVGMAAAGRAAESARRLRSRRFLQLYVKASTIGRRTAAIRYAHKFAGLASPTDDELVKATVRGIRRTLGTAKIKKEKGRSPIMKVLVTNGRSDSASLRDVLFCSDIVYEHVPQSDQIGNIHRNTRPNNDVILNRILLKQGRGVWPYLSEGQDCRCLRAVTLEREVKRSVAKHFCDVVRVGYWHFWHSVSSLATWVFGTANSARE
jgi:hypothetical protein